MKPMETAIAVFTRQWVLYSTGVVMGLFALGHPAYAVEPVPVVSSIAVESNSIELAISNIDTGGTYYVESIEDLTSNNWTEVGSFEGITGSTNWMDSLGVATSAFYRVVRDPYHPNVGKSAALDIPGFHDVSGTAHLVNNRTVELRNFNFDGGGIVVQVYLSPNPTTFSPYVAISEDLFGTVFNDATVTLDVPVGTDLNSYTNISIWCVVAGVSFGDGSFQ